MAGGSSGISIHPLKVNNGTEPWADNLHGWTVWSRAVNLSTSLSVEFRVIIHSFTDNYSTFNNQK